MSVEIVRVAQWPRPKGYQNGMLAEGRTLFVAGQIGWNERGEFVARDLPGQFAVALDNVLAVVAAAGGAPEHVVKMTVYVTDMPAYRAAGSELGKTWQARLGRHYVAMALVGVTSLVERDALVEIEAVAVLPRSAGGA